ncbi:hypothetical protein [Paracoccus marinaquae]|uniref:Uncharacterized protein n=1 Tax=Paracoccus marinaquae TaxID=2841926 RepID=A0ABS6AKT6_9RHOB|nr:hypothetical protein [Paracoccus marinaquae]MBU3030036.1 hypothetical protein [Paracoccus marinaquae]
MTRPFRRRILYIPGFDPIPPRRYREMFRRESARQAGISGYRIAPSPRQRGTGFGWCSIGHFSDGEAEARFEVLIWDDLVQASMRHGIPATYAQLVTTAWIYIGTGTLFRLMRLRRGPVLAALYPVAMLLLQGLLALALGAVAGWAGARLGGWWLGLPLAALVACALLIWFRRLDGRLYAHYLMHDYAFTARDRGAYPEALEARLARFSDQLAGALNEEVDEVLVVGHSSGAYLAVSLLADVIRSGRVPPQGPALALMTLGQVVPMASFLPRADRLRADLAFLSEQPGIFWLDVSAPGDACCFGLCDPVAVSGVAGPGQRWPLVVSAAFTRTLSPQMQRSLRHRWFRLHFQYLHAFDRPGDYDYFAITAGPRPLASRFAARSHSPGRITRPVGRRP